MSEKIAYVPGRIKSAVKGGHVAGVEDIIDDALGKEQSVINQEVAEDVSRLEQKVDEIGDAIQFDEDGDLVTVDGDDFSDPDASAKIPTIGAIKGGADTLGIVYDVSAKNPTAGPNNDGKFTLEYILNQNNVNTLIPTSVRKGGMSIKFVQSSDNKYVQYRYMGTDVTGNPNPFLDTANWQGVDDEPTVGSNNLVKSGGVEKYTRLISPLYLNLKGEGNTFFELYDGFITQGKEYTINFEWNTSSGEAYFILTTTDSISDTNKQNIFNNNIASPVKFIAEHDYKYIWISTSNSFDLDINIVGGLLNDVKLLEANTVKLSLESYSESQKKNVLDSLGLTDTLYMLNRIVQDNFLVGKFWFYYNGAFTLQTNATKACSHIIVDGEHLKAGDKIVYYGTNNSENVPAIYTADANQTIKRTFIIQNFTKQEITVQEGETDLYFNVYTGQSYYVVYEGILKEHFDYIGNTIINLESNINKALIKVNANKFTDFSGNSYNTNNTPVTIIQDIGTLEGEHVEYKFTSPQGVHCFGFFNEEGQLIGSWIGNPSSISTAKTYAGIISIPANTYCIKVVSESTFSFDKFVITSAFDTTQLEAVNKTYSLCEEQIIEDGQELFGITNYSKPGDLIHYSVQSEANGIAYIELLNENYERIEGYGVASTKSVIQYASGTFILPVGFAKARVLANSGHNATVHYIRSEYNTKMLHDNLKDTEELLNSVSTLYGYSKLLFSNDSLSDYNYIPVNQFIEDDVDYTIHLKVVGGNIDKGFYVSISKEQSSVNTNTIYLGSLTDNDVINQTEVTFVFRKIKGVPANFIRFRSEHSEIIGKSISLECVIESGTKAEFETLRKDYDYNKWNTKCVLDNRLASPIFESFEHYNEEHQSSPIVKLSALTRHQGTTYRIPSVIVTNANTVLVAGQFTENQEGDFGDFSIHVARKTVNDAEFTSQIVVPCDYDRESYGNTQNCQFLVDRTGVHGHAGRIYLFFTTTLLNKVVWEQTTESVTPWYIYSDDDGVSWSAWESLKSLQDTSKYQLLYTGVGKGIQLSDGTLIATGMAMLVNDRQGNTSSGIMFIKKPNEDWSISPLIETEGYNTFDEGGVVQYDNDNVIFVARNNTSFGRGEDGMLANVHHFFKYNINTNSYEYIEGTFFSNVHDELGIDAITISGTKIYLMTFIDQNVLGPRTNITLWASLDCNKWIRVYRIESIQSAGYSAIDNYNGRIVVAYEDQNMGISYQDITILSDLINNTAVSYIENVTLQDRLQMIYNKIVGID